MGFMTEHEKRALSPLRVERLDTEAIDLIVRWLEAGVENNS